MVYAELRVPTPLLATQARPRRRSLLSGTPSRRQSRLERPRTRVI